MADTKISALTAATTPLAGTEVLPIVQSGATKKVSVADLTAGREVKVGSLLVNYTVALGYLGAIKSAATTGYSLRFIGDDVNNRTVLSFMNSGDGALYSQFIADSDKTLLNSRFSIPLILQTNDIEAVRIDASQNVKATNGNLVIGTSGKGIDFSATSSGSGTMTSELLNDYEEGTFTPTLVAATTNFSSITYSNQYGYYTKIGRLVHIDIYLQTSGTSGGSGTLQIANLPFVALGSSTYQNTGACIGYGITFAGTLLNAYIPQGTSVIQFLTQSSGGAWAALSASDWGGGVKVMKVSIDYIAN